MIWRWFWALVALNILDWSFTTIEVRDFGADVEANPLMHQTIVQTGYTWFMGAFKIVMLLALAYGIIKYCQIKNGKSISPTIKVLVGVFAVLILYHLFILWVIR